MTDNPNSTSPPPPIDLDEFERQLRDLQSQPKQSMNDPLAELARIVGQDDPFRLSQDLKRQGAEAPAEDALVEREPVRAAPQAVTSFEDLLSLHADKRSVEPREDPSRMSPLDELAAITSMHHLDPRDSSELDAGPPPDFLQAHRDAVVSEDDHEGESFYEEDEAPSRSRSGLKIFVALVVMGIAGVGGVWGYVSMNNPPNTVTASTPLIAAKPGPLKEKPANPGGLEVPNQNANILERKDDSKAAQKVLAREEQPIDLNQAAKKDVRRVDLGQAAPNGAQPVTLVPVPTSTSSTAAAVSPPPAPTIPSMADAAPPASLPAAPAQAKPPVAMTAPPQQNATTELPQSAPMPPPMNNGPKKVKSVRITAAGEPEASPPAATVPAQPKAAPVPAVRPPAAAQTAAPVSRIGNTTPSPVPPAAKAAPRPPAKQVAAADTAPPAEAGAPLRLSPPPGVSRKTTTPAVKQKPVKAPEQIAAAPTDDDTAAVGGGDTKSVAPKAAAPSGSGKFAVQFGAPGSTEEANKLIGRLKSQYPTVLSAVPTHVVKADVNGRAVYRVRTGALSREKAVELCTQVKAAGGNCFIGGA